MCKRRLFLALIATLLTVLFLVLSRLNSPPRVQDMRQYLLDNDIPALRTLSYFSPAFVDEQIAAYKSWQWDDRGFWTIDYNGAWFHSTDGHRLTPRNPTHAPHSIYVLGDSLALGLYLSDDDTLTAALQRRVGQTYRVVNLGAIPATLSQQVARLKSLVLRPGDIVVLWDTVTDLVATTDETVDRVEALLFAKVAEARAITSRAGTALVVVQVPYEFEQCVPSGMCNGDVRRKFASYPQLRDIPGAIDLSGVVQAGDFIDPVHVDARGNEALATALLGPF